MSLFKNTIAGASFVVAAFTSTLQAADLGIPSGKYALEKTHASLIWRVNHLGLSNYTARFTKFDASLNLDVDNVENSTISATIDPTSVETDHPEGTEFDEEIASDKEFLNASKFPTIEFTSSRVEKTGDHTALVHGTVTMLGVSKPLTLEAAFNGALAQHPYANVPAVGFHAEGTIKRSEFGFEHLLPYIGDDVSFVIEAEFIKN